MLRSPRRLDRPRLRINHGDGSSQLNGKVERSHRTDQQEFYQLLSHKGDVDLEERLAEWDRFYNFDRPSGAFAGQTPYEALRERLQ